MNLPESFENEMKALLGASEYNKYLSSLNEPSYKGIRYNRLKIDKEKFLDLCDFGMSEIPFIDNGFIYTKDNPAKDAYYHAGLYYLQEPSAMLPANRLPICENDKVLDLCAAPGGKATELLGKLNNTGLLYANDISASRAYSLLKNLELTGAKNYYVTAETPERLSEHFVKYFDKILCDVPCSGEGMFRKDPSLIKSYEENGPLYYQKIQRDILDCAYKMLKPGGHIMYSTCTFSPMEDEENIAYFLDKYDDMSLEEIEGYDGFTSGFSGLDKCVRVFPHKMIGEGHFLALMKKMDSTDDEKLLSINGDKALPDGLINNKDSVYRLPDLGNYEYGYVKGLRYIRTGLYLGDEVTNKKNKMREINLSTTYALSLLPDEFMNVLLLAHDDDRVIRYLKGETIFANENEQVDVGYTLVCCEGYPLGFAKCDGNGKLKNLYNSAWRMN